MKLGIVSLPNVGKSTLFDATTNAGAESANYPFYTIDPNVGVVAIPDRQLDALTEMYRPKKATPAMVEFVDIVGLIKDAPRGQGLGNRFLTNIRECNAIVHVMRCFSDENIICAVADTSTNVPVDPAGDIGIIDIELIMADVKMVKRHIDKAQGIAEGDKKYLREVEVFSALKDWLNDGSSVRSLDCDGDDAAIITATELLPLKSIIYAASLDGESFADCHANAYYKVVEELAAKEGTQVIPVYAKLGTEVAGLDDEEKEMFLDDLGIAESGLDRLVKTSYALLGLIPFLTSGEGKCRAWTIKQSTETPRAAGKVYTDFKRGFIRAEMVNFDDLMIYGSMNAIREKDPVRSRGKEYIMKDGDIVLFRFNV